MSTANCTVTQMRDTYKTQHHDGTHTEHHRTGSNWTVRRLQQHTHTDQYSDHCNYDNNTHLKTHLNTLQKQQHTVYGSDLHDSPYVRADKSCYKSALECHRRILWWNPMWISYDGFQCENAVESIESLMINCFIWFDRRIEMQRTCLRE